MRLSAWIWDFSSTHNTIAFSGGFRYRPTTSRTLASSSGSVENLKVSRRHGLTPYLRQARATVASPIPKWLPSSRDDQWVTPSLAGGGSRVAAMIAASSIVFGRPGRCSSSRPAIPWAANRSRHLITVGRVTPTNRAAPEVPAPPATASTMRARSTCPAGTVRDRVQEVSVARSSSLIVKAGDGMCHLPNQAAVNQLMTRDTRSAGSISGGMTPAVTSRMAATTHAGTGVRASLMTQATCTSPSSGSRDATRSRASASASSGKTSLTVCRTACTRSASAGLCEMGSTSDTTTGSHANRPLMPL